MSSAGIRRTGQGVSRGESSTGSGGVGGGGRYQTSGPCLLQHHRGAEGGNWEDKEEKGKWRV